VHVPSPQQQAPPPHDVSSVPQQGFYSNMLQSFTSSSFQQGFVGYTPHFGFQNPPPSIFFESSSSEFRTTFSTPLSAYNSLGDYHSTLTDELRQTNNIMDGDYNAENNIDNNKEPTPQPERRGRRRGKDVHVEQERRVLPPRNRRRPNCGTESQH
jgi:hypothetical protein